MYYLVNADARRVVETIERADALEAQGWQRSTREAHMAAWEERDTERMMARIVDALIAQQFAPFAPVSERAVGKD